MNKLHTSFKSIFYSCTSKTAQLFLAGLFLSSQLMAQPPAVAPLLGNASTFAVFSGSGGVTNSGINTVLHGSMGTVSASTSITGFHDGVNAAIYTETTVNKGIAWGGIFSNVPAPGTGTSFAFAALTNADVLTAYNNISPAAQSGGIDPAAGELGGLTLTPGVYKSITFKISNLDLTLDAQGDPNAVWIFQTTAALTVGIAGPTGARSVLLTNGALARNVYWYVGSGATINGAGGGVMSGTIISSAAITFSTVGNAVQTTLNGRALCLNAGITMNNTTVNACDTWTGLSNSAWTTATNWSRGSVPLSSEEVLIPDVSTNQPNVGSTTSSLYNLTLYNGAALTVISTLQIGGFMNNLGTAFNALSGTITTNGSLPQTIPANTFTNGNTVQNLIVDNNKHVSLGGSGNLNISGLFTLTNGLLKTGTNNILIIGNNASVAGAAVNRYVDGNLRKVGNQAFTFPIGNGVYAPISISAPANAADHFTANYVHSTPNTLYPTASLGAGLNRVSSNEYWMINRTNGSSNVDVTLSFDYSRSGVITVLADLRVAEWNGTQWTNQGNTATTGATGNGTVKSNAALTAYGPFTLGSSTASNSLPINLVNFTAIKQNNAVSLQWQTSNEISNDYFNIQHSTNGHDWTAIGTINASGTASSKYSWLHASPMLMAKNYYRLQQVDKNGNFTYSLIRTVDLGLKTAMASVYPNPVRDNSFTLDLGTAINKPISYSLHNAAGLLLKTGTLANRQETININGLAAGNYLLKLSDGQTVTVIKL
jgi:hypothetical protein